MIASEFRHSRLAKDVEISIMRCMDNPRSCSARADEMSVSQFKSGIQVFVRFGLHANVVEDYVL